MASKRLGADFTLISVSLLVSLSLPSPSLSIFFSVCLLFCFVFSHCPHPGVLWLSQHGISHPVWSFRANPSTYFKTVLHQNFHQLSVLPRLPPSFQFPHAMLSPAVSPVLPSLKPTSVRGRHVVICATLPPTVVRQILQALVFHVFYSSNLQGWAYPSMHWVTGVALRRGHWMQRLEWLK